MLPADTQPGAARIPPDLVRSILVAACGGDGEAPSFELVSHDHFSNDHADVKLVDGRRLVVKRGRHPWSAARLRTSRIVAGLLRDRVGIVAPRPLEIPPELDGVPLDAYWRIELPTLAEAWPRLGGGERRSAMRSLGRLVRRIHGVRFAGHGALTGGTPATLFRVLADELKGRLLPAVSDGWPAGVPLVERLVEDSPEVAGRAGAAGVLLHGDLHLGNVLCERAEDGARCVGLLDLECAHAGPAESDLARLAVMHTDLFGMELDGPWLEWVLEGYGRTADPVLFGFYSTYHLVELGFYSALVGHDWHADRVAAAAGGTAPPGGGG